MARAREFAERHVAPMPRAGEWERRYPLETIKASFAEGLQTIELARKHGGQGFLLLQLRAFEEFRTHFASSFA